MSEENKIPGMIEKVRATINQYELVLRILKQKLSQKLINAGTEIPNELLNSERRYAGLQPRRKFSSKFKHEMRQLAKGMKEREHRSWLRIAKIIGLQFDISTRTVYSWLVEIM